MPGLADLLYLGQPDPARQLAMALAGRQQAQQGAPPPGAAAPPAAANGAPAPAGNPAPGDASQNAPTVPNTLKSTPDMSQSYQQLANPPNLMSLYLQLDARNRASQQINSGLALIAANHSAPGMREAIMQSANAGQQDAGQQVNNLMSIYQGQQQMGAQQDMLSHASEYDTKLGLPPGTARDMILQGKGSELVGKLEPTEQMRSLQQARDLYKLTHPNATPEEVEAAVPTGLFVGQQGGDASTQAWLKARALIPPAEWGDHPELKDALTYNLFVTDQKKRQDNVDASAAAFGQYHGGLMDVRGKIAAVQSNPDLNKVLQNPLLISAVKAERSGGVGASISGAAQSALASATPEQKQLVSDILDLSDPDYIKALQGKASASTQGDVLPITQALAALGRFNTAPKQYTGLVNSALDAVDNADANAYGASGQLDQIDDDNKRKRVSGAYLPGGASFVGQGKSMPADEIAAAKDAMKNTPKAEVIDLYRRHGFNTKPIE